MQEINFGKLFVTENAIIRASEQLLKYCSYLFNLYYYLYVLVDLILIISE